MDVTLGNIGHSDPSKMVIKPKLDLDMKVTSYKDHFIHIIENKCRVFLGISISSCLMD